jgi:hypothetical protein
MALINTDGIRFSNSTELLSKYGIIPRNTVSVFYQTNAPTGWTQFSTLDGNPGPPNINNRALRVVNGVGGASGGSITFTSAFPSTPIGITTTVNFSATIGAFTLTTNEIPSHTHNSGGSAQFVPSGAGSPYRLVQRNPVAYNTRVAVRTITNARVSVSYRQPVTYRQPVSNRQPQTYRRPVNVQQPRNYGQPNSGRNRYPFNFSVNSRQPFNRQQPNSGRRPYGFRYQFARRVPFGGSSRFEQRFAQPFNFRRPYFAGRSGNIRRPVGGSNRAATRVPSSFNIRNVSVIRNPANRQQPFSSRRPYSGRIPVSSPSSGRNRVPFNTQTPFSTRRPYNARVEVPFRVPISTRVVANQRVPVTYRQPVAYRVITRYPVINNVRYPTRVLAPGGTMRGTDTLGPVTGSEGGGGSHDHTFTGSPAPINSPFDLRVQYIDVIVCRFTD